MVVPTGKPPDGASLVMRGDESTISNAVASPRESFVKTVVASDVMSPGVSIVGGVVSTILTFWEIVALFPAASVAVHVTMVVPTGKPPDVALFVTTGAGSRESMTDGATSVTSVRFPVASLTRSAGCNIMGGSLSEDLLEPPPPKVGAVTSCIPGPGVVGVGEVTLTLWIVMEPEGVEVWPEPSPGLTESTEPEPPD
jgi:hypothetical protein